VFEMVKFIWLLKKEMLREIFKFKLVPR
jgi:hypothetical protein